MTAAKKQDNSDALTFEVALKRLEATVGRMEAGDLPLDEAMKQFEHGMTLAKFCTARLGETEKRIEILMKKMQDGTGWEELPAEQRQELQLPFETNADTRNPVAGGQ
jgi:exodeoxyribonuclease VII small subunit